MKQYSINDFDGDGDNDTMTSTIRYLTVIAIVALAPRMWCQDKTADAKPPKAVVDEVTGLVKKLGDDSFKVRRTATKRLLEIARFAKPDGAGTVRPYNRYVCDEVEKLFSNPDPEISQRAKEIVKTLRPFGGLDLEKFNMVPYAVDQEDDTIQDIAEMYASKPAWIKEANPGLKTDKDLQKFKTIQVPVLKDDDNDGGMVIEIE